VAALITVDPESTHDMSETAVHDAVQGAVDSVNAERSRFEQIKRFTVLPREFTLEAEEMTPTLKLRRKVILDHFAHEAAALYDS
jgi:long-chain acyl-CoA synthetase